MSLLSKKIRQRNKVGRCIGLEIGSFYIRAVQIARDGENLTIEKIFSTQTRRTTDSLTDILKSLTHEHGFDRHADVAVSMPLNTVFFHDMQINAENLKDITEQNLSALEYNFPIENNEIISQVYSYHNLQNEKYSVLIAAADRRLLRKKLQQLTEVKIHPTLIDAPISAIHSTIAVNHPDIATGLAIIAYINESYLIIAITKNNDILITRNIPIVSELDNEVESTLHQNAQTLTSEIKITWRKIFGTEIEQTPKIYIITKTFDKELATLIEENLQCQTIIVDPLTRLKILPNCKTDTAICIAEGMALRVLAPEKTKGINFLDAINSITKPRLNIKKELTICVTLLFAIATFWLIGLFTQLSYLESNYEKLKNEIRKIFQRTIPNEKNIVSPSAQLQQRLDLSKKDHQLFASFSPGYFAPLGVLHSLSTNTPSNTNVKINDLLIATDSVRLTGTCDSFETAYQWQRLLQKIPAFTQVDIKDIQKQSQNDLITFTIIISSKAQEL